MRIHAHHALLPDGWARNVGLSVVDGIIDSIRADAESASGDDVVSILLPGMPNLHSHAFQRGMAGLAERRGPEDDDFWSWREVMYRFALSMSPDDLEAVAAQLYVEMLEAGYTRVGEFHYLHHDPDGRHYDDIAEMATRICAAAVQTGINLTLLPVLYRHGSFGGTPSTPGQRRFVCTLDDYGRLLDDSATALGTLPGGVIGVAPHSLRAVDPRDLQRVAAMLPGQPIHMHVAEQVREVEDCLAWCGARPVEWLLEHASVDSNWCLIHATHMTAAETRDLAGCGAVVGLCPITEANLGDGVFNGPLYWQQGGLFGIGSDSNVQIDVAAELRQLQYAQRLAHRSRNLMTRPGESTGETAFQSCIAGGTRALDRKPAGLAPGASADFVSLRADHVALTAHGVQSFLDAWIFSGGSMVDCVWTRGARQVTSGRHHARESIRSRFSAVMRRLAA